MEHLTPAELLRFLEEEANTLQLMNAKISNQLHCLQVEEEFFSRQLSNLGKEKARPSDPPVVSGQSGQDVNGNRDREDNFQNETESEELELHSTAPAVFTDQELESDPTLLESSGTRNSSGASGQEPIELERDHDMEDLKGHQQEQEVLKVNEPTPSQRNSGRISRRPARFQD
ncbi:unnamed protein product [Calypogeia fissa]